jgi:hypothetical protein
MQLVLELCVVFLFPDQDAAVAKVLQGVNA